MGQGLFISFEGIEGCGKTTQATLLVRLLESRGIPVLYTREPGGTPIGDQIRKVLLNPENQDMTRLTELLLFGASRAQHVQKLIRPNLEKGVVVICDRYSDATLAYQGAGRELKEETIQIINGLSTTGLMPDLTILLDVPVELGLDRARRRNLKLDRSNQENRFEEESLAFHRRVQERYLKLASMEPDRIYVIDGTQSMDMIQQEIGRVVLTRIRDKG